MPERAEIEAVVEAAQAVVDTQAAIIRACTPTDPAFLHAQGPNMVPEERDRYAALFSRWHRTTRNLAAALDRVRDARGDDERDEPCPQCGGVSERRCVAEYRHPCFQEIAREAGWSPQGESDEARDERGRRLYPTILQGEAATAARLAEHSPARDGTVAVEDAQSLVNALRRIAYGLEGEMGRYDTPRDDTWWGRIALEALAEFGSARAGESDEGGSQ